MTGKHCPRCNRNDASRRERRKLLYLQLHLSLLTPNNQGITLTHWKAAEDRLIAPSMSWGSCPVPAQAFQTITATPCALSWDLHAKICQSEPADIRRSARNLHLRRCRCRRTTQKQHPPLCRRDLFVAEHRNSKIKSKQRLNPLNPTNPSNAQAPKNT